MRKTLTRGAVLPLQRSFSQHSSSHDPLASLHAFNADWAASQYALVLQVLMQDLVSIFETLKSTENVAQRSYAAPQSISFLFLSQSSRLVELEQTLHLRAKAAKK